MEVATIARVSPPANSAAEPRLLWADLHSHSLISDGILSPALLVQRAYEAGVRVLALTDHDTVAGVSAARAAAPEGLEVIPGIEISAHLGSGSGGSGSGSGGSKDVHLLGYFAPHRLEDWSEFQLLRRRSREERFEGMLERLSELGVPVDREQVLGERAADPERVPGRPHLARALVTAGHVPDMQAAFDRYLGREGPAYVAERGPSVAEAIAQVHRLGGVAVVAHPIYGDLHEDLRGLREAGLDGVEAYHFGHDAEQAARYQALAVDLGLLVTGGSDFHGEADDPQGERSAERLGRARVPEQAFAAFVAALRARSGWSPRTPSA